MDVLIEFISQYVADHEEEFELEREKEKDNEIAC